jgi:DNA replication initiation complex subunit (GINS family)
MEGSGKFTYETLFDLLRNEKNREELQILDEHYFTDLVHYIKEKEALLRDSKEGEIFASAEKEKTLKQLENVKKLVRDLYERREKKILNMALINSKTGGLLDKSAFLEEEKLLFEALTRLLEDYREGLLFSILAGNIPKIREKQAAREPQVPKIKQPISETGSKDILLVRFLHPVPKFLGKDLEVYGPFEEEDMANLPNRIAEVLVSKGRAELIHHQQSKVI